MRDTTLAGAVIGQDTLLKQAALVIGGSLFIALASQVSIPFYPVPLTLQTLAILMVGLTYGARLGGLTLIAYLAEGAMGLPVFANGASGLALIGPTAGFLVGFALMAWMAGFAADRGLTRGVISTSIVTLVVSAFLYIPGAAWPMAVAEVAGISGAWVGTTADAIWAGWVAPFLLGDAVKAVLAAMIVTAGWKMVERRKQEG